MSLQKVEQVVLGQTKWVPADRGQLATTGVVIILSTVMLMTGCASNPTQKPAPVVERTKPLGRVERPTSVTPVAASSGSQVGKPSVVAPVKPVTAAKPDDRALTYTVKKGDTLYSIALENGQDYREVAEWNQLEDVNLIKVDQVLRLTPPDGTVAVVSKPLKGDSPLESQAIPEVKSFPKAVKLPFSNQSLASIAQLSEGPVQNKIDAKQQQGGVSATPAVVGKATTDNKPTDGSKAEVKNADKAALQGEEELADWVWPSAGKMIAPFSEGSKGLDIGGKQGQPVLAAHNGKVVYAGTGLRGYGKLIIIKHNKAFLSAYAHNNQILVKEGDTVKKGDKIAEMGNSDAEQVKLHFEIRRFGKPVDPTRYITAERP